MRSLPLALTARLAPVVVLATAGWALAAGPLAAPVAAEKKPAASDDRASPSAPATAATAAARRTYRDSPAPCEGVARRTVASLVPGAEAAGKELPSTDESLRRTCSWNALKGFDYRWLDISYEIKKSDEAAQAAYEQRTAEKSGGGAVPGIGDDAYSVVNLTTADKQQTREGTVIVRASNALVVVTYDGSDFETRKAPGTDEINKGALRAAEEGVAALEAAR
nr:hypothetical protein [Streptomyces sp. REN17]